MDVTLTVTVKVTSNLISSFLIIKTNGGLNKSFSLDCETKSEVRDHQECISYSNGHNFQSLNQI
jgi:hypothetical protein